MGAPAQSPKIMENVTISKVLREVAGDGGPCPAPKISETT